MPSKQPINVKFDDLEAAQTYRRKLRLFTRSLNRLKEMVDVSSKNPILAENQSKLKVAKGDISILKTELKEIQEEGIELIGQVSEGNQAAAEDEFFSMFDELQSSLRSLAAKVSTNLMNETLSSTGSKPSLNTSAVESNEVAPSRYPKIPIPTFDGDIRKFQEFKSLFRNMVHEEVSIPPVKKLWYLKEALRNGQAFPFVKDVALADDAYYEAWNRIAERYDNKRAIIHAHLTDMFKVQKIKSESNIGELLSNFDGAVRGLKVSGCDTAKWSTILSFMLMERMDERTRREYDNTIQDNSSFPEYKAVYKFLTIRATNIDARTEKIITPVSKVEKKEKNEPKKSTFNTGSKQVNNRSCMLCNNNNHALYECKEFLTMSPASRFDWVRSRRLCFNCLGLNHTTPYCKREGSCKVCSKRHHSLLHREDMKPFPPKNTPAGEAEKKSDAPANSKETVNASSLACNVKSERKTVWLPSAVVKFRVGKNVGVARILLDNCSQPTLISDKFIKKWGLPTSRSEFVTQIQGVSNSPIESNMSCSITLQSRFSSFEIKVIADVVPGGTMSHVVNRVVCESMFQCLGRFNMADSAFQKPLVDIPNIDIVLGAEYVECVLLNETEKVEGLTLRNTNFGWVLSGAEKSSKLGNSFLTLYTHCVTSNCEIDDTLRKFWSIEELETVVPSTNEQSECEEHFVKFYSRESSGRFVVRLPLKYPRTEITNNYRRALWSLLRVEKSWNSDTKRLYEEFMEEYQQLGHMSLAGNEKVNNRYYIPHRAVWRPDSSTTKLRVVFNASSTDGCGRSLNEACMVGPSIQPELFEILVRFRCFRVAISADIAKMYRQVWVDEEDRDLQCILWRNKSNGLISTYKLNTVTYGIVPASFLATRCLAVLADELEDVSPRAAKLIRKAFYMDDFLGGADSRDEAVELLDAITSKLASAGFHLRKYLSNDITCLNKIVSNLPQEEIQVKCLFEESEKPSVLGLIWDPQHDVFSVRSNLGNIGSWTKRTLLAEIARIFDPLGFLSPITIRAKILMQLLWREQLKWDDPVPEKLIDKYLEYRKEIVSLFNVKIPRFLGCDVSEEKFNLIGFCDASQDAYCAAVYYRTRIDGAASTKLVAAKTRVAPIKQLTIPRLELEAAVLLAKLLDKMKKVFVSNSFNVICFSDSRVVLGWLSNPPKGDRYVSNRVSKIGALLPQARFYHVSTKDNPADMGTRGLSVSQFLNSTKWWNGPAFVNGESELEDSLINSEVMLSIHSVGIRSQKIENPLISAINTFSSYERLVRTFTLIIFITKLKLRKNISRLDARKNAIQSIFRIVQETWFPQEVIALKNKTDIPEKSRLLSLSPFLDSNGVLRLGGRLQNSRFTFDMQHPVILKANAPIVTLIIREIHEKYYHANQTFLASFLMSKFWFIGSLSKAIRRVCYTCTVCTRFRAEQTVQLMGSLPASRVEVNRPFTVVGVDLAGPFECKCVNHRTIKVNKIWLCVFICLTTRAVHLEVLSSQSAEGFLMTLRRCIARRGLPRIIWSDNGTNFVGAKNKIVEFQKKIANFTESEGVEWRFIPPGSPHKGGAWEAAVKSAKFHLKRVTKGSKLTYEEYSTLFADIERILNSRPLCYRHKSTDESIVITPAHFLIGSSLLTLPELAEEESMSYSRRMQLLRSLTWGFWRLWRTDYLAQLQLRTKWKKPHPNVQVDQVVLLKVADKSPGVWPYGKIVAVYPDSEGLVRVVDVLAQGSVKRRSVSSIVALPIDV